MPETGKAYLVAPMIPKTDFLVTVCAKQGSPVELRRPRSETRAANVSGVCVVGH